ncbi:MAG: acylneuraminate cytidylyltransferase family protein [Flavobacteriaceae bacterium]|nr:acylneuraminate cytidylyltransferase family protein [Flavobacteriaceae bacterium]NNK26915.1 acylneuraminate cytidylyltransferase family protein [Flavobacteriaceae bacterium]
MKQQKNIIIIPARGGSKRLPKKNLILLNEKPLIEYTLDYAKANLNIAERVIVSTDDEEIKDISLKNGIEVQKRPEELSGDNVPTVDVLKHVITELDDDFDNVILLQVTNPLRPKDLLSKAYRTYIDGGYSSLMTVTRNFQKFGKIVNDEFVPYNYEIGQRSQDLEPLYFENGLLYITKTSLIEKGQIMGVNNFPYIVNHPFAHVDIDTKEDLDWASFLANSKSSNEESTS